jgi:hypothetical protein
MKQLFFIISIVVVSCCSNRKTAGSNDPGNDATANNTTDPACITKLIADFKAEEVQNPPRKIYRYTYRGKTVYYVPALCCDFYSELYDTSCNVIGHPDGGFTGRGDGTMTDFDSTKTNEQLIWADERGRRK